MKWKKERNLDLTNRIIEFSHVWVSRSNPVMPFIIKLFSLFSLALYHRIPPPLCHAFFTYLFIHILPSAPVACLISAFSAPLHVSFACDTRVHSPSYTPALQVLPGTKGNHLYPLIEVQPCYVLNFFLSWSRPRCGHFRIFFLNSSYQLLPHILLHFYALYNSTTISSILFLLSICNCYRSCPYLEVELLFLYLFSKTSTYP